MRSFLLFTGLLHVYTVFSIEIIEKLDDGLFKGKECHGTTVGFGYSGTLKLHYQNLKKRYKDCTYVHGNLEITNIDDPKIKYDLGFLDKIRYVSGYVLIGLVTEVEIIPLKSLEVVRGNKTYRIMGEEYSFVVALTSRYPDVNVGLKELHLPALREISEGNVMFSQNPSLCHVNTIAWDAITRGRNDSVLFGDMAFSEKCENCSDLCDVEGTTHCWGPSPALCQEVDTGNCHESCPSRCFGPSKEECCNSTCAVGCDGPSEYDCKVCKDLKLTDHCVSCCPSKTYQKRQECIKF